MIHFNITEHPTEQWTAQQVIEAFPYDQAPRYLIRDRDSIYGETFKQRVNHMGIKQVLIAYRSPWQNPYIERLIGSIRRECLDHIIVLNEGHLRRIMAAYVEYYNHSRLHLSLDREAPVSRLRSVGDGEAVAVPQVGGLHHRYERAA